MKNCPLFLCALALCTLAACGTGRQVVPVGGVATYAVPDTLLVPENEVYAPKIAPAPAADSLPSARKVGNNIYVQTVFSRIISEINMAEGSTLLMGNPRNGFSYGAGYEYVFRNGFGVGASFLGYKFGFTERITSSGGSVDVENNNTINSFMGTASLVQYSGKWCLVSRVGLGYAMHSDVLMAIVGRQTAVETSRGVSCLVSQDIVYTLTDTVRAGFNLSLSDYIFPSLDSNALRGRVRAVNVGGVVRIAF